MPLVRTGQGPTGQPAKNKDCHHVCQEQKPSKTFAKLGLVTTPLANLGIQYELASSTRSPINIRARFPSRPPAMAKVAPENEIKTSIPSPTQEVRAVERKSK